MHGICVGVAAAIAALIPATNAIATGIPLTPGLYQIEVRISLPNVQDVAQPLLLKRCVTDGDLAAGRAFFVLSDNPLKNCDLLEYRVEDDQASFRIVCPGPNKASAIGVFSLMPDAYRGSIKMNMGGKNMTMTEAQIGKRMGACP